ncbi:MAG: hypothetical protein PHT94_03085 [Candidatus Nanoarchaeia archaeon]|nr:hypothetical protein [Candidatus Nanoarchaeia archaeon]
MIGKPEWFSYKIFGWGLRPKRKEGWIYILIFVAIIMGISYLPIQEMIKSVIMFILIGILLIDTIIVMIKLDKLIDEREKYHQLITERAASITAVFVILVCFLYSYIIDETVNIYLIIVLLAMTLGKAITYIYAKKKL